MKRLFYLFLLMGTLGFAQEKPAFDEALAKQLGGDEYGMKNYVLVILKTGDKTEPDNQKRNEIFKRHLENISRMANEGQLAVAGPFGKNDNNFRGVYIFNVTAIEEAKELVNTDPAVKAGLLKGEFYQWMCSAALMKVNEIHQTIAKEKF